MSQWTDRIESHGVFESLENLGAKIDEAIQAAKETPQAIPSIERIRTVLTFTGKRLAGVPPDLLTTGPLDAIRGAATSATEELAKFVSDPNHEAPYLVAANDRADAMINQLGTVLYPLATDDFNSIRAAGVEYQRTVEAHLATTQETVTSLNESTEALDGRLEVIREILTKLHAEAEARAKKFDEAFTSAETERASAATKAVTESLQKLEADTASAKQKTIDLAAEITAERGKLTSLASEFQSQFSTAQENRNKEHAEAERKRQDKFTALTEDYSSKLGDQEKKSDTARAEIVKTLEGQLNELKAGYQEKSGEMLEKVRQHLTDVEKLVGVIGNLGVTAGHLKTADAARSRTTFWQAATVIGLAIVIYFAYIAFLPLAEQKFSWEQFAGKVFLTAAVGVFAAYAARQADRYMEIDRRNRKLALELQAIGPFLDPLPEQEQHAFRIKLGERTFGRDDGPSDSKRSPATTLDLLDNKDLVEQLATLIKAIRP